MKIISGTFQNIDGTPVSGGRLFLKLSQDAVALNTTQVSTALMSISLDSTGSVPAGTKVWFNDELSPANTTYTASVIAAGGGLVWGSESIYINGTSFNLDTAVPTSQGVSFSGVVLQNPTNSQTITGFDLNISGANFSVSGNAAVGGTLAVAGNETIGGNLIVTGTITGSGIPSATGTANTIAKFTGTNSLGNSSITDDGTTVTSSKQILSTVNGAGPNAGIFISANGNPTVALNNTGGATDAKLWDNVISGSSLLFRTINDANNNANNWMSVTRTGFIPTNVTFPAPVSITNQQGKSRIYVDQYASWAAAFADCPTAGCTLDGRSPNTPTAIGTFDPGTSKAVTILLGPMTYTLDHMILRSGLVVKGMGIENIQGTKIQAVGTSNQAPFIMPTSGAAQSVQGVLLSDFELEATVGNTAQDGFFFDVSVGNLPAGSNLELSKFSRIFFNSFKGSAIHLKGPIVSATSVVQFNDFELLQASPPASNTTVGSALRMEGAVAQNIFWNFDATQQGGSPTETLIYAGVTNTSDTVGPYSNWFYGASIQNGAIGVLLNGCQACTFRDTHMEQNNIGFQVKNPTTWHNNKILLDGGVANGNVAVNSGAGRIVDASDSSNNFGTSVEFSRWAIEGSPDKVASSNQTASTLVMRDISFDQAVPSMGTIGCTPGFSTSTTTLNTVNTHYAFVNSCSGGAVSTLTSGLGVGEILTLYFNVPCTFAQSGGNIILNGYPGSLAFNQGEQAQFINGDQSGTGNQWLLVNTTAARSNGFFSSPARTTALGSTTIYTTGATDTAYLFTMIASCKTASAAATVTPVLTYTDPSGTVQTATLSAATCTTLGAASQSFATSGLNIKASTNVNISATIANTPTYDIRASITKLGAN